MLVDIRTFGAQGDGKTLNTPAIQKAIDSCEPGDTLLICGGIYLTGALFLKSHLTVRVAFDAVLLGSRNRSDYPLMDYPFEGVIQKCYASLLNTDEGEHEEIAITGGGCIDADGMFLAATEPDDGHNRGRAVCIRRCKGVRIENVSILHSPSWSLHLYQCSDILISQVKIHSDYDMDTELHVYPENDDGVVLDSCEDAELRELYIRCHDDCISIKSGKGLLERKNPRPTKRVRIHDCEFYRGSGIAIGSEMSGGVGEIEIYDNRFINTFSLFCLKTTRLRGGYIRGITVRDCEMKSTEPSVFFGRVNKGVLYMDSGYLDKHPLNLSEALPEISGISFLNIRIQTLGRRLAYIHGIKEIPFRDITMRSISSNCTDPDEICYAEVNGQCYDGPQAKDS